ncbi:hypothetical protein V6N13_097010 [Hibiscus sabdariffa]|uniref:Uncharacterized protein n=1 Tax=Hibiscus sabdariffa TaxID=183260 RepID=A0ABR2BZ32_9ROSI
MIGEYDGTNNMEGLMKAQALKDNNIVGTATSFSSTAKPKFGVGEAIRRDFIVETFEQEVSVAYYVDDLEGHDQIKVVLAHIKTRELLKILLVDNFVHAYMHPENTLVRVSLSKTSRIWLFKSNLSKSHVIFLDVGITVKLSNGEQLNLLKFFKVVACRNKRTTECMHKLSQQQNCQNVNAFIEEVEAFPSWGTPKNNIVHHVNCML